MATTSKPSTLYILYNADASLLGKLNYGYRKICTPSSAENPACAACDITHGGLSLNETPEWSTAKKSIEADGVKVTQWHRDEMSKELRTWFEGSGAKYPAIVRSSEKEGGEAYELVLGREELAGCGGDPHVLVKKLRGKGVLNNGETASL